MSMIQQLALVLIGLSALLVLVRLVAGPSVHDRLVASDTLAVNTTAGLALLASVLGNPVYLDVALLYGALSFVGVIAVARTLERGNP